MNDSRISLFRQAVAKSQQLQVALSELDGVCLRHGFTDLETFLAQLPNPVPGVIKAGRPGYHGPTRMASNADLQRGRELDVPGASLVDISMELQLSYQACLKWRKRKWQRPA